MISRSASGILLPKNSIDTTNNALSQKDKIICILEKQLETYGALRENYQRLRDRRNDVADKCESLAKQICISKDNQEIKIEINQKSVNDLRIVVSSLENQLQSKNYQLKDLKCEAQSLIRSNEQRQNDLFQFSEAIDSVRSSIDILRMEAERIEGQIGQTREQITRVKQYQLQTQQAVEKVREQNISTQSFIRKLAHEENQLTQNLSSLEDQNNQIDEIIQDLSKVHEITRTKLKDAKEEKEDIQLKIRSKQLEKGRIATEFSAKIKLLRAEKQKQKNLKQLVESRTKQIARMAQTFNDVQNECSQIANKNIQIQQINCQLQKDLDTCRKHVQNVSKNNLSVKESLEMYSRTNKQAIKKLQAPVQDCWGDVYVKKDISGLDTAEGFMHH